MPPPTVNRSNPAIIQSSDSISGPENTTGQDFIFSPRTARQVDESESSESETSYSTKTKGKAGSVKPAKKTKPVKKEAKNKRVPSKGAPPLAPVNPQPLPPPTQVEKELVQKVVSAPRPITSNGKQTKQDTKQDRKQSKNAANQTDAKSETANPTQAKPGRKKGKKCCAILSGAGADHPPEKNKSSKDPKKSPIPFDFVFETKAQVATKKPASVSAQEERQDHQSKMEPKQSEAKQGMKSMKSMRPSLENLPVRDYSACLLPSLFPVLPSFEPTEMKTPPRSKPPTKRPTRSKPVSIIMKYTRRGTRKKLTESDSAKRSRRKSNESPKTSASPAKVKSFPAAQTKFVASPKLVKSPILQETPGLVRLQQASTPQETTRSSESTGSPVLAASPSAGGPPEPRSTITENLSLTHILPLSEAPAEEDLLPPAPPPPRGKVPKLPRHPTKHITPPETTTILRKELPITKKKGPTAAGKKAVKSKETKELSVKAAKAVEKGKRDKKHTTKTESEPKKDGVNCCNIC